MSNRKIPHLSRWPKRKMISFVSKDSGVVSEVSEMVIASVFKFIQHELVAGGQVRIKGFGTFRLRHRKGGVSKIMSNFSGGGRRLITVERPSADHVNFKAHPDLKAAIWAVRKPVRRTGEIPH